VSAELKIEQASPRLLHLLHPGYMGDASILEGHCITRFLGDAGDRQLIESLLTQVVVEDEDDSGIVPAAAMNVHLYDLGGHAFPAQLLHCFLPDADDSPRHLVGIRLENSPFQSSTSSTQDRYVGTEYDGIQPTCRPDDVATIEFDAGSPRLSILRCSGFVFKDGEHDRDLVDILPQDVVDDFVQWISNEINDAPNDASYVRCRGTWNCFRVLVGRDELQAERAWLEMTQLEEIDDACTRFQSH